MTARTTRWRPWFCRIYFVIVVVAWNVVLGTEVAGESEWLATAILVPFMLPALYMGFSLGAFKFDFSAFGRRERTPQPPGTPLASAAFTGGAIGWFRATAPFFHWSVFGNGVGLSCWGIGSAFVPLVSIRRIKPRLLFGGCKVFHDSPEVRSPLEIPSTSIRTALERLLGQRRETLDVTERVELDASHDPE